MTDTIEAIVSEALEIASERDEKAAESMMMAEAHRNSGHYGVAAGWDDSAKHALRTATVLRKMAAQITETGA